MIKPKVIAYYLPQYHPFKENDEWWGKGFTEWTNVGKAKPLFHNHYQPKVPSDLGYYDLRMPEIREQQAQLAKEAGIYAFCYWHYWFGGKGRQLLNEIIDDVIESHKPDFPFCFGWANESWKAKQWEKHGTDKILMEQRYCGKQDYDDHFEYVLKAFKDKRYVKIENKPLFLVYKPHYLPDDFIEYWNNLALKAGFSGIYFVARLDEMASPQFAFNKGFEHYTRERSSHCFRKRNKLIFFFHKIKSLFMGIKGMAMSYDSCMKYMADYEEDQKECFCPSLLPNWDHSPRSGRHAYVIYNSTPNLFYKHALQIFRNIKNKKNKIVFLKSWNEWGEGNYMEPDLKYGKGYIRALSKALKDSDI